jgi:hypothetical protein
MNWNPPPEEGRGLGELDGVPLLQAEPGTSVGRSRMRHGPKRCPWFLRVCESTRYLSRTRRSAAAAPSEANRMK